MAVGVTSAILASVVCLAVGLAVLLRKPRRTIEARFSVFALLLFGWHAAFLAWSPEDGPLNMMQYLCAALLPWASLRLFDALLPSRLRFPARINQITTGASFVFVVSAFTPWSQAWPLQVVLFVFVATIFAYIARTVYRGAFGEGSLTERRQLRLLLGGGLVTLLFAAGIFIPTHTAFAALGHLVTTLYVYMLYQSIVSYRLINLRELAGKAAVVGVLTVALSTVYALLVRWVGKEEPGLWLFNTVVASFVILILYDQLRAWVEHTTTRFFFQERYVLQETASDVVRRLRRTINITDMTQLTLDGLFQSGQLAHTSVFLRHEGELVFRRLGFRGAPPPALLSVSDHHHLLQELRADRCPLMLADLQDRIQHDRTPISEDSPEVLQETARAQSAIESMRTLHATLLLPLLSDESLLGFLCVGREHADTFADDEVSALLQVAEGCGVVVYNSQEFARQRQRERLAAIGEMATGMAHEIRNPLGAIKGAAQCLDPTHLDQESREFLDIIVEEVDRLNVVVSHFLDYARPYRGKVESVNVNDVVRQTVKLLEQRTDTENIEVRMRLAHDLEPIQADAEHIKQVLLNLAQNAIDAMPKGGTLEFATEIRHSHPSSTDTPERHVVLRVSDTGIGIAPDVIENIFVPFFTTKNRGTGLGLPICQHLVESMQGSIDVNSGEHGTEFVMTFAGL